MKIKLGKYRAGKDRKFKAEFEHSDMMNLDVTLALVIAASLREFKKKAYSYPHDMGSMENWTNNIQRMIDTFDILSDDESFNSSKRDDVQKGIDLFAKYFTHLWT